MGQDIVVRGNRVEHCLDVCLDAEGSRRILFEANEVRDAGNSALAVFFLSEAVTFRNNRVTQTGSLGSTLFNSWNPSQTPSGITIVIEDNVFEYTGGEVGRVTKQATATFRFQGNRMRNVAIDLEHNNAGRVEVIDNLLEFDRPVEVGLHVGANHGSSALVRGNRIRSQVAQSGVGIGAWQADFNTPVLTEILGNEVRGFPVSIRTAADSPNPGMVMRFRVSGNRVSGRVVDASPPGRSVVETAQNQPLR